MEASGNAICLDCGSGCAQCESLVFVDDPDDVVGCEKCPKFSLVEDISVCKKCDAEICIRCTWESNYNTYCEECVKICERCSSETHFYRCRYSCVDCGDICCEDCLDDNDMCVRCIELKKQHSCNNDTMEHTETNIDNTLGENPNDSTSENPNDSADVNPNDSTDVNPNDSLGEIRTNALCEQKETTDDDVVTQDLSELEISDQLAGAIYAVIIIQQRKHIDEEIAVSLIRTLYERDTSQRLLASQLVAIFRHKKIMEYSNRVLENINAKNERDAMNSLERLDEIVAKKSDTDADEQD